MKLVNCLSSLTVASLLLLQTTAQNSNTALSAWPVHDNGLNDVVQWDHYSFKVNGKRLFVFSGELHYWRIPVPSVWRDLLEKIKAAGFTAYAFYGNWAWHSASDGTLDFETGAHNFESLLTIAKEVGLYVIVRPGPYVNAEANAGGFPLWLTTGAYGKLRTDDPKYTKAWKPYFEKFSEITSKHLVTNGGNAIVYQMENEYGDQWEGNPTDKVPNESANKYMTELQETARANGIDIPVIHNDPNMYSRSWSKDFSNETGNVDIAGLDSYPSCWSCNLNECTGTNGEYEAYKTINYYDHFAEVSNTQPKFFPEFQGGSYNPWDGPAEGCPNDIGADFANLFYRDLISQQVSAISLYMMYGGTNWGAFAAPVVATSYDYSSPIQESRGLWSKYSETKNIAMFTRVARDLTLTDRVGNSTDYSTNPSVKVTELRNPETKAAFYVTVHADSTSSSVESFKVHVSTSVGNLTIPQRGGEIVLNGHQSKILTTDFKLGDEQLVYSTAEILTYSVVDGEPVLVLSVGSGESAEFMLEGAKFGWVAKNPGSSHTSFYREGNGLIVSLSKASKETVIQFNNGVKVVVADKAAAYNIWAPNLTNDPLAPINESVIVSGPYLVRGISSPDRYTLALTGDSKVATSIEVWASRGVKRLTWNGKTLIAVRTTYGSLIARVPGPSKKISLPRLSNWKVADSLPEANPSYNDNSSAWVDANHNSTENAMKPDTLPVLYVDDYGFHASSHLFRGYFAGPASGVHLSVAGGTAFGWSAWLNGAHIGSFFGNNTFGTEQGNLTLSFTNATVYTNTSNVLLVVQDNTGHGLRDQATNPRGILKAALLSNTTTFSKWKIAGTAGGEKNIDAVRGPLNEGGLTAERLGWHLPGFDASKWSSGSPSLGFSGAGIQFYRTVVPLTIPNGLDAAIAFSLSAPSSKLLRAQLFVNGYQYGRFNPNVGNQVEFPVPPGILNYNGDNTIGLVVWAQSEEGAKVEVDWKVLWTTESSWTVGKTDDLRPGWTKERLEYA
ncbi:hypothetical protein GQ43DRAFT_443847 [Delitschia confertaspora ATCC 74209]|uniref:beta-galactosidase n=1 Tax=Delitschia confertaspora ATCC 74209 TaxID=1513339 RepID=A0A9P4JJJ9_9PLEO|nr:hypothetical protein GQ43DRAFT_443847 [Delitschia confertaspora ATCC 74209]